jgi:8-oxo-dGTP pyrophosphatase MutT (NUDIX family)
MARPGAIVAALKSIPGGARYTPAPQSGGFGRISPVQANAMFANPYQDSYGPFLPRPSSVFTDGAFAPMSPIQPVPLDVPPPGGLYADPRWWQATVGWNLPTQPGSEGLKLASFDQLYTLANRYCLSPMTRVLCSDFSWRPLTEITVGDELIGFDENPPAPKQHRKMRITTVTDCDRIIQPSYRVRFADGREVVASAGHLWLSGVRGGNIREYSPQSCEVCGRRFEKAHALGAHRKRAHDISGRYHQQDNAAWIATDQLRPGSKIKDLGQPWQRDGSWEAGYLSGVFDGEASFAGTGISRTGWGISFPQLPGAVFDLTESLLKEKGFHVRSYGQDKGGSGCATVVVGGLNDCFRFLGEIRPIRLLENAHRWLDGKSPARTGYAVVESVEFLGDQEVVAIGTSTKTLIAEGLFSHNSVARQCIELRKEEIRGLEWDITLTSAAAKAYQGDRAAMRDFGERKAEVTRFFQHPDPDFWNFSSFLDAMLEEIFVYDALTVIFRPKYGASFGMGGRGLLGSDLDSINLVSGPTIRPLIDMHGGRPRPPAPAYQQYLYGVPRSDYMTIATGRDIDDYGLAGAEVNEFRADIMLYAPLVSRRETPYGFPPVERALLPIISGLQKQEFQLDYFTEGTVPAVYISPGDPNITPTQIGELQNALNALAGDPAYHLKVVVLPPGSKVEPQRPVDLSDSFDYLVMNQVTMSFDVMPQELGIIPDIGQTQTGPSASAVRFAGQEVRDIKARKSTKPILKFLCDIFNYAIQDICQQPDMQFQFNGLVDDEDKMAITQLGVEQIQNGVSSIDEIRERLDLPPWGLQETSEPIVMTQQGPVPFSMAPQLLQAMMQQQTQGSSSSSSGSKKKKTTSSQPSVKPKRGASPTKPNGSHPAPVATTPSRPSLTPAHAAAAGALQRPQRGKTGGTPSRSPVAGSRKRGEGLNPTRGRLRNKAALSELDALRRHLNKGRHITTWEVRNLPGIVLSCLQEDLEKGIEVDVAIELVKSLLPFDDAPITDQNDASVSGNDDRGVVKGEPVIAGEHVSGVGEDERLTVVKSTQQFPGWEHDLGLVGRYKEEIAAAFQDAEVKGSQLRKDAATGKMWTTVGTLHGLISDATYEVFADVMTPLWEKAWNLGYEGACQLLSKDTTGNEDQLQAFLGTEGEHWLQQVARTGLKNADARTEIIARTEVARAMNAGAMQAYKDNGVQHKHLLVAPDDTCKTCKAAKQQGVIPLDAIYPGGEPPFHPQCRCVSAPAGINVQPPQSHIGKSDQDDESRIAWLLIRARDEDGKWRYLLQERSDGTWGMPGGTTHVDEPGLAAAYRETQEEIGDLPPLTIVHEFSHPEDDGKYAYLYLCEASDTFTPQMNGSTPEETAGVGWFKRKEIADLDLTDKFRDDWENHPNLEQALKESANKSLQNMVNENGEWLVLDDPDRHGAGMGARWPYPHHSNGEELGDAGPGGYPGMSPGGNPPHFDDNFADHTNPRLYEDGDEEDFPQERGTPPSRRRRTPRGGLPEGPATPGERPGLSQVTANTGVPPSGEKMSAMHPVVGIKPPKTPAPSTPRPEQPEVFDPADAVEHYDPSQGSNVVADLPKPIKKDAANPTDPNPVEWRHVYTQLERNFPNDAIEWVKRARWIGPVNVPWDRIDTDDEDKWAASHQPEAVSRFARGIASGDGNTAPSVLVQEPGTNKAFIVDGHHRAKARHYKLNKPVLAYVGNIDPKDRMAALETHTKQIHQGKDPGNK